MKGTKKILLAFCFVLSAFSCTAQMMSAGYYDAVTKTKNGVLVASGTLTTPQKANVAHTTLSCKYIRADVVTSNWTGSLPGIQTYIDSGLTIIANVSYYATGSQHPFLTSGQVQGYKDTLLLILTAYPQIKFVSVSNEEFTQSYHSGTLDDYGLNELKPTWEVCHPLGVFVADGGLAGGGMDVQTYRYVDTVYGRTAANQYASDVTMSANQIADAQTPGTFTTIEANTLQVDSVFKYNQYVDVWLIHFYEPFTTTNGQPDTITTITPNVFRYQKEYVERHTRKFVGTNEFGQQQNNAQAALTTALLKELERCGYWCAIYYSGLGGGNNVTPLADVSTGAITATGTAYKAYVITK